MGEAIERLAGLIPPPAEPLFADGDWAAVEAEYGPLPAEWKAFIRLYGSGQFHDGGNELRVTNPLDPFGRDHLGVGLGILRDTLGSGDIIPAEFQSVHPERPGLMPWGGDDTGSEFCFWTSGRPDEWTTAAVIEDLFRPFDCGLGVFLLGTLARVGPSWWYDAAFSRPGSMFPDVRRVRFVPRR